MAHSPPSFREKVDQLSAAIDEGHRRVSIKDQCFPTAVATGVVAPFATMLILFLSKPSFVRRSEGTRSVLSVKKMFWYTLGITILIWGMMYIFNMFRGFDRVAMMCVV